MENKYVMGIDIGTQSVKVCIFDIYGKIQAKHTINQYMDSTKSGWATEKPEQWWKMVCTAARKTIEKSGVSSEHIVGVGCGAVMHSPVGLTKDGELTDSDVQLYCDKRNSDIVTKLHLHKELDRLVHNYTSNTIGTQWMGMKICWIKENEPEKYSRTYKFISAKDYINYELCGEFATDPSEASGTALMCKDRDEWSEETVKALGLDIEKLPRIVSSSEVVGKVHNKAAAETGLKSGTPVVCGGGDMLCGLLGSGLTKQGLIIDLTGTGSVVAYYDNMPWQDEQGKIANLRHVINGWTPYNSLDSSGGALRWYVDSFCKKEFELAKAKGENRYSYLDAMAERVPAGSEGVIFFPYLQGERNMGSPYAKGIFFGMTPKTGATHLYRGVMEGIGFELYRTIEIFKKSGEKLEKVIHTGGAANSRLWSQIKADIYGLPVEISTVEEATAWGAAILAAVGVGIYSDIAQLLVETYVEGEILSPNINNEKLYSETFELYKDIHDKMQEPFAKHGKILGDR